MHAAEGRVKGVELHRSRLGKLWFDRVDRANQPGSSPIRCGVVRGRGKSNDCRQLAAKPRRAALDSEANEKRVRIDRSIYLLESL
jgi:hypothetical protein